MLGLIQLPRPITPNRFVRPVKLPTNCGYIMNAVNVIAIGNGRQLENSRHDGDKRIRHAYLQTSSYALCAQLNPGSNLFSKMCAMVRNGQSIHCGDSGIKTALNF